MDVLLIHSRGVTLATQTHSGIDWSKGGRRCQGCCIAASANSSGQVKDQSSEGTIRILAVLISIVYMLCPLALPVDVLKPSPFQSSC
jgi:hypothetical protein